MIIILSRAAAAIKVWWEHMQHVQWPLHVFMCECYVLFACFTHAHTHPYKYIHNTQWNQKKKNMSPSTFHPIYIAVVVVNDVLSPSRHRLNSQNHMPVYYSQQFVKHVQSVTPSRLERKSNNISLTLKCFNFVCSKLILEESWKNKSHNYTKKI